MNYKTSIIVPTRNSQDYIAQCLKSIQKQTYKNIEIIVVDNNSNDKTKEIAKKYTHLVFNKGPERSAQRNFGAAKAKGEYLLFIDSDMELAKDVVTECMVVAKKAKKMSGIIIPEISIGESFWAKCKALERSFYWGVEWIEAPRFFSKTIFKKYKGYDIKQTGTEDFDLPQRIKNDLGSDSILRIKSVIYHNEGNLALLYTLKKKYYYTKTITNYIKNETNSKYFKKQASPLARYKLFLSNPKQLLKNPILGAGMLFMKSTEFAAGGLGYLTRNEKHH